MSIDEIKSDGIVKFTCSETMLEQRWTHITLVWAKGMLKTSAVTLYINGKQLAIQKVRLDPTDRKVNVASSPSSFTISIT